jgi:hypothetical protein
MRLSLATLFAASLLGPWSGCDRQPVTPPAAPPGERAPELHLAPTDGGILLKPATRRLG